MANAAVAQLVEQRIRNAWVGGSSPFRGTNDATPMASESITSGQAPLISKPLAACATTRSISSCNGLRSGMASSSASVCCNQSTARKLGLGQLIKPAAAYDRGSRKRAILKCREDAMALARAVGAAQSNLIEVQPALS
jgi:hypothetical protein